MDEKNHLQHRSAPAWQPYAMSAAICGAVALLAAPLHSVFDLSNIVMMFLLAVVVVATRYGRGPAVLAAFLSVAAFDFFYVPPRFTFSVADAQYLVTFGVMLVVALLIAQLTAWLQLRERRASALYRMSRDLSGALTGEQVADIAARFLQSQFGTRGALLVAGLDDRLGPPLPLLDPPSRFDAGVAQWAYVHGEARRDASMLYLPLKAPTRTRGVLAIEPNDPAWLAGAEQERLLDTGASLLALSLERVHYVEVAQATTLQVESERLRNSLLAAISHDLRTPLAALVAMAESMSLTEPPPAGPHARIAGEIRDAALRMSSLVDNLLDMARLQSGQVRLNRQWLLLEEVVGSALKVLGPAIAPGRVRVTLPSDLPLLHLDAVLMERVLCNLLENAAKYTPPGSPIEIGAVAGQRNVTITVDDHGPGLPAGREASLFQMFERGRKEGTTPGVGLGLAICRAVIEAHGGTIRGETRPHGGARFTLELPRGEPPALAGMDEGKREADAA